MGFRTRTTDDSKKARLVLRKETLRELRTLGEDELRAAAGGLGLPPPTAALPSCKTC